MFLKKTTLWSLPLILTSQINAHPVFPDWTEFALGLGYHSQGKHFDLTLGHIKPEEENLWVLGPWITVGYSQEKENIKNLYTEIGLYHLLSIGIGSYFPLENSSRKTTQYLYFGLPLPLCTPYFKIISSQVELGITLKISITQGILLWND